MVVFLRIKGLNLFLLLSKFCNGKSATKSTAYFGTNKDAIILRLFGLFNRIYVCFSILIKSLKISFQIYERVFSSQHANILQTPLLCQTLLLSLFQQKLSIVCTKHLLSSLCYGYRKYQKQRGNYGVPKFPSSGVHNIQ